MENQESKLHLQIDKRSIKVESNWWWSSLVLQGVSLYGSKLVSKIHGGSFLKNKDLSFEIETFLKVLEVAMEHPVTIVEEAAKDLWLADSFLISLNGSDDEPNNSCSEEQLVSDWSFANSFQLKFVHALLHNDILWQEGIRIGRAEKSKGFERRSSSDSSLHLSVAC